MLQQRGSVMRRYNNMIVLGACMRVHKPGAGHSMPAAEDEMMTRPGIDDYFRGDPAKKPPRPQMRTMAATGEEFLVA